MIRRASRRTDKSSNDFAAAPFDRLATHDGERYPTLHLLRLLAAISIFTGHWSEPYVAQLWPQGQIAIDVFFMIEGFLSMRLLAEAPGRMAFGRLVLDRLVQVYPTYVIGLVVGFCAFAPLAFGEEQGWTIASWLAAFFSGLLLMPTFSPLVHGSVFPLNPPTWAIVLELIGFVLFAATQRRHSSTALLSVWAGAVVMFAVLAVVWHDPNAGWSTTHYWGGLPRMIFSFFGGAILFPLHARADAVLPKLSPVWMCAAFFAMHLPTLHYVGWPLLGIGVPLLISFAASSRRPGWSLSAGAWAARNALIVYVLGYPVMMIWRAAFPGAGLSVSPAGIGLYFSLVFGSLLVASMAIDAIYAKLPVSRWHLR